MASRPSVYIFGPFVLDPKIGLFRDERLLSLPPKELALLELLVSLQGKVARHSDIEQCLWPRQVVSYSSLARCVYSLRRLLGGGPRQFIETVPKRGYRMAVSVWKFEPPPAQTAISQSISTIPLACSHYFAGVREANDPRPAAQDRAILLFQEAARVDPQFAAAYGAVADTRMYQLIRGSLHPAEGLKLGLQACSQALESNPSLVQALAAMGWFQGVMGGLFEQAHNYLGKALAIDPDYSRAYMYRSWVRRCQGQASASAAAAQRAIKTDPHALLNRHSHCWALFCDGRAREALVLERKLCGSYPRDDIAQGFVAIMAAYLDQTEEALLHYEATMQLSAGLPATCAAMAYVLARAGKTAQARQLAIRADTLTLPRAPRPMLAAAYCELGDLDRALDLLQRARKEGCPWFRPSQIDPRLNALASNPRFVALFDATVDLAAS